MSLQPPELPPVPSHGTSDAGQKRRRILVWSGFATTIGLVCLPFLCIQLLVLNKSRPPVENLSAVILALVFGCFVVPFIAGVLCLPAKTRSFGLGMLLASGVGWLILGAICGGMALFSK